jgi:hypothetical protein
VISFSIIALVLFTQDTVPLKAKEEFEIKFELSVKQRPYPNDTETVRLSETKGEYNKRTNTDLLPYLKLNVKIITSHPNEAKLKVFHDNGNAVFSRKVEHGMEFKLDLGFTDDIKDRVTAHKYVIRFYTPEKKEFSKIEIEFDTEGNYFVNGERRGRI